MGSRILSRSFLVEPWSGDEEHDEAAADSDPETRAMDVDQQDAQGETTIGDTEEQPDDTLEIDSEDSDDEGAEDLAVVAMVPIADMLNARYESENAKLFYEAKDLRMVATKPIKAGEQVWNTYGDLPNSDLLRRYGHVDLVPVPQPLGGTGNPADVVEIRGDLAVAAVTDGQPTPTGGRVDWWLENADDDTFVIGTDCELPEDLVSFVRLLLMPLDEWEKASGKTKLPKPKVDLDVLTVIEKTLARRMQDYPSSLAEDEQLLESTIDALSLNRKHAIIVRVGEQRILRGTLNQVRATKESMKPACSNARDKKRPREATDSTPHGRGKKSRR